MPTPDEFDATLDDLLKRIVNEDITTNEFTTAAKNYQIVANARPADVEPTPEPKPVPETAWGKVKAGASTVWESETTRAFIKAGGAFAGVALVVWSSVHRDHVLEKTALSQANQRSN